MEPCRYYPRFEPNQVLTAEQLNQVVSYLDTQERLTRALLIGVGPLCGLQVSRIGITQPKIVISRGVGITTHGYLMAMGREEYTRYRSYTDPSRYGYFWDDETQLELYELLPAVVEEEEEGIHPLKSALIQDKAVILYLEKKEVDLETCTGDDCDEKGTRLELCIKPLLIKFSDLKKIIAESRGYGENVDLESTLNARFRLPEISIGRLNALTGFDDAVYYPQIHEAYREVIEKALPGIKKALAAAYHCYRPLLQPAFPADAIDGGILDEWFEKFRETRSPGIQYFYDFLKDIILGYNEFTRTAFDVITACVPEKDWFPRHLMLGPAIPEDDCEPSVYRQQFIASPLHEHLADKSGAVLSMYRRLALMVKSFILPDPGGMPIRITPSREDETPLSPRSIPYYYDLEPEKGLHQYWNYELRQSCDTDLILSYNSHKYQDASTPLFARFPLNYDTDDYPHYRIEGHLGHSYGHALRSIQEIIRQANLPVKLLGLKLGQSLPETDFDGDCRFEHLEVIYNELKSDLKCWLDREIAFFSNLEYGRAVPDEQEGVTGIRGRIINRAGEPVVNARVYLSTGKVIATSQKDGSFGPVQLSPAFYELIVYHPDYQVRKRQISLKKKTLMTLEIQLNPQQGFSYGLASHLSPGESGGTFRYEQPEAIREMFTTRNLTFQPRDEAMEETFPGEKSSIPQYQIGEFFRESVSGATYEYTVGDLYQTYSLSAKTQDLLSYTYNTLIAEPVIDIADITDIVVVNVYYPLQIIQKIEGLLATLTSELHQFSLSDFQSRHDTLLATAESYREQLQSKKPDDPGQLPQDLIAEILRHLRDIIHSCYKKKFETLHKQFRERIDEIRRLRLFGPYLKRHSGMEHQAGVPKGGTFFLIYDDQERVVADFMLPYVCCSDCPPVALCETTPIVFKLPKESFCSGDEKSYRFILSPPGGTVTGPGVDYDDTTGDYHFNPASEEVEGEKIGFKYNLNDQVYLLETTIIDLTADLAHTVQRLDPDNNVAVVEFRAKPVDAESYHWEFGDGETADVQNPTHTYDISEESEFDVVLTVSRGECEDTAETSIAFDICSAEFTYEILEQDAESCLIQFSSAMEDADEYEWDFGDGSDGSDAANPQHTFDITESTEFIVRLRVVKGECEDESEQAVGIAHACNAKFEYVIIEQTPESAQVAFQPVMEDAESYRWDFGDGSEGDDRFEAKPVHTYSLADGELTFDASLEVTRGICRDQSSATIEFEPCSAGFSFEVEEQGPDSARVSFTPDDTDADHYQWNFGDGSDGSEEINPVHTFQLDGPQTFQVLLTVTRDTCTASNSETVQFETCTAGFSYTIDQQEGRTAQVKFTPEMDDADTYKWDFGNGQTSEQTAPTITYDYSDQSTFTVRLEVAKGQCSDQQSQTITFETCDADFAYEIVEQSPEMVVVKFTPLMEDAQSYLWDFGDGTARSSAKSPQHTFKLSNSQVFTVTLQIGKETCEDTHEETLKFETCTADFEYQIVERDEEQVVVQFKATMQDADEYLWDFGDDSAPVDDANPQHVYKISEVSQYAVKLQVKRGSCSDELEQTLLFARCTAKFNHKVTDWNERQARVQFTPVMEDAESYFWEFGDQSQPSEKPAPLHTYDIREQRIFKVTLTVSGPACEDQYSERITINVVL